MNPNPPPVGPVPHPPPPAAARPGFTLWFLGGGFALFLMALALLLWGHYRGDELQTLRGCVQEATRTSYHRTIECRTGRLFWAVAGAASRWVQLPAEARTALASMKSADVGVFRAGTLAARDLARVLSKSDALLKRRGWERLVGVIQDRDCVGIYVPSDLRSERDVSVCVIVLHEDELVLVRARADLAPLLALAAERGQGRWSAGL